MFDDYSSLLNHDRKRQIGAAYRAAQKLSMEGKELTFANALQVNGPDDISPERFAAMVVQVEACFEQSTF